MQDCDSLNSYLDIIAVTWLTLSISWFFRIAEMKVTVCADLTNLAFLSERIRMNYFTDACAFVLSLCPSRGESPEYFLNSLTSSFR